MKSIHKLQTDAKATDTLPSANKLEVYGNIGLGTNGRLLSVNPNLNSNQNSNPYSSVPITPTSIACQNKSGRRESSTMSGIKGIISALASSTSSHQTVSEDMIPSVALGNKRQSVASNSSENESKNTALQRLFKNTTTS